MKSMVRYLPPFFVEHIQKSSMARNYDWWQATESPRNVLAPHEKCHLNKKEYSPGIGASLASLRTILPILEETSVSPVKGKRSAI